MTYEEALNFDQKWTALQAFNDLERYLLREEKPSMKAVAIAMQALEKQIPKKIITKEFDDEDEETKEQFKWTFYLCPVCGENIALKSYTHCHCGQALDWSNI